MKIAVLNGSPKGAQSVTLRYAKFLENNFPDHFFNYFNIAQAIYQLEKDAAFFDKTLAEIASADIVLWAFPLYVCLPSSQQKRFIELLFERGAAKLFAGKFAAVLTTSLHYFDHTAHQYMRAICDDLNMRFTDYFSAEMYGLLQETERKNLLLFAENVLAKARNNAPEPKQYPPLPSRTFNYAPAENIVPLNVPNGMKIIMLHDSDSQDGNLRKMVYVMDKYFGGLAKTVNIREIDIKGGCLGCIKCAHRNICVYQDGYMNFCETRLMPADVIIMAGKIRDRALSSKWKMFIDRGFYNTHRPVLANKQFAFIISGPLGKIPFQREIFEGHTTCGGANLAGIVTDESEDSKILDRELRTLAENCLNFSENNYMRPMMFAGVGARKLFRDAVWGELRFVFTGDHKFYKKHGIYDFPQYKLKNWLLNIFLTPLLNIPFIRKQLESRMKEGMTVPLDKFLSKNKKSAGRN